jgi:hypothetical protein
LSLLLAAIEPRGLQPDHSYVVDFIDEEHHWVSETMSGRQLTALEVWIPKRHQSLLVRYAHKQKL